MRSPRSRRYTPHSTGAGAGNEPGSGEGEPPPARSRLRHVECRLAGLAFAAALAAGAAVSPASAQSREPPARGEQPEGAAATVRAGTPGGSVRGFGPAPAAPAGPLAPELEAAVETVFGENLRTGTWGGPLEEALGRIGRSGDPRAAWLLSDLMRIVASERVSASLAAAAAELTGIRIDPRNP
jgi:hypothetical protein